MNKLYKYISKQVDEIFDQRTSLANSNWLLMTSEDRIINYTYSLFIVTRGYQGKSNEIGTEAHVNAYLSWLENLLPLHLEEEFNSHEIMELFSDE